MLKEVLSVAKVAKKSSLFLGGVAFGTLGLKILASKEAKKGYSKALAKAYKLKDELDASVSVVKQHGDDVLQDAKYLYEQEKKEEQLDSLIGEDRKGWGCQSGTESNPCRYQEQPDSPRFRQKFDL